MTYECQTTGTSCTQLEFFITCSAYGNQAQAK